MIATSLIPASWLSAHPDRQELDCEKHLEQPLNVPHSLWVAKSLSVPQYPVIEPIRFSLVARFELFRFIGIFSLLTLHTIR